MRERIRILFVSFGNEIRDFVQFRPSNKQNAKNRPPRDGRWKGYSSNIENYDREGGPNRFILEFNISLKQKKRSTNKWHIYGNGAITPTDIKTPESLRETVQVSGEYHADTAIMIIHYHSKPTAVEKFVGTTILSPVDRNANCVEGKGLGWKAQTGENENVISEITLSLQDTDTSI